MEVDSDLGRVLQATVFSRLLEHLQKRNDVQNIDLMNLAGFCRNCLAKWYMDAAENRGIKITESEAKRIVYGMDYSQWKKKYQK